MVGVSVVIFEAMELPQILGQLSERNVAFGEVLSCRSFDAKKTWVKLVSPHCNKVPVSISLLVGCDLQVY